MSESIAEVVSKLKSSLSLGSLDESATKQGVVLRLLSLAGWNPFDLSMVVPEYTVGKRRVDYALRLASASKVFIEVKRPSEDLAEYQRQLLDYCFQQGVRLAVLTNGRTWWFYLPLREGSWEQRRFLTIDLESQEPDVVESRIIDFLSRDNVGSGKAVDLAEELISSQEKADAIRKTIIQAWNEIVEEPEELLIDLISETTERICGFKPDSGMVEDFLSERLPVLKVLPAATSPAPVVPARPQTVTSSRQEVYERRGFTGAKPSSFAFLSDSRAVESWLEILIGVCEVLHELHRDEFNKVLSLRGRKRQYFSTDGSELRKPRLVEFAGVYVETNLSANAVVSLCNEIIKLFGYSTDTLKISAA